MADNALFHWSVDQCEYATDIVFRKQAIYGLPPLRELLAIMPGDAPSSVASSKLADYRTGRVAAICRNSAAARFHTLLEATASPWSPQKNLAHVHHSPSATPEPDFLLEKDQPVRHDHAGSD
jgi:hypothetical protein